LAGLTDRGSKRRIGTGKREDRGAVVHGWVGGLDARKV
jgi:hypothetical protein